MKPNMLAGIIVAIIVACGGAASVLSKDSTSNTQTDAKNSETAKTSSPAANSKKSGTSGSASSDLAGPPTMAQVKLHNSKDDCWTVVSGVVYDITSYVPRHPGGDEILRACGADGTSLFTQRETATGEEVGSGTPHSNNAARQLESLKIGTLSN